MNIIDETVKLYFDYGITVQEALEWAKGVQFEEWGCLPGPERECCMKWLEEEEENEKLRELREKR